MRVSLRGETQPFPYLHPLYFLFLFLSPSRCLLVPTTTFIHRFLANNNFLTGGRVFVCP